ncbi:MAG: phenylalanine--tRNA ligase subunit beta, partial [Bacteroidota bacterium]|nr:phenylalanine--tRNA ligase subunit beta [Bacteroidota bacterium]
DCPRYSGVSVSNLTIQPSPDWLQNKLKAIGLRPINNIVDITNFILHETGQPLHAFDADAIAGNHVIVKNEKEGTPFITLDGKERKLHDFDLMICNETKGMCIAGVFGGAESGVKETTKNIFLESACFNATSIRRTSVAHALRTDAAARFEKGTDISETVMVLQRAAMLIKELAGGEISSDVIDIYSQQKPQNKVTLAYSYLQKLSGKKYHQNDVKTILLSLGFDVTGETAESITVLVPYSKVDISLPADLVEEIVRIDGLDNIAIPSSITISPAKETHHFKEAIKEKISQQLAGLGFYEIVTNSITNSKYFSNDVLNTTVKMINNLSADLDVLRPSMLQTGLEAIAYNLNRKNDNLRFFEWGKTYFTKAVGDYTEPEHLSLYITGDEQEEAWNKKTKPFDLFAMKGFVGAILSTTSLQNITFEKDEAQYECLNIIHNKKQLGNLRKVEVEEALKFDIKQPVYFADLYVDEWLKAAGAAKIIYKEVPRFPAVQRDLAMIVNKSVSFAEIEAAINKQKLSRLTDMRLFDIFESEKLGADKKSLAVNFTFSDEEKTLTDKEIDGMMNRIMQSLQTDVNAEIRK